jgi:DNA polymerase III subunit gamma/tau
MVLYLKKIASDRKVIASDDALHLIAQKADGGMRDALSLFDKMASFCNGNIEVNEVLDQLNILDYEFNFKMIDAMMVEDKATILNTFQEILMKGFEGDNVLNSLAEHFRNLLICRDAATVQLLEVSENIKEKFSVQTKQIPINFLLSALNIINECDLNYRSSKNKRLHVELCLIKLCYLNRILHQVKLTTPVSSTDSEIKKKTDELNIPTSSSQKVEEPASAFNQKNIPITANKASGSGAVNSSGVSLKNLDLTKMKEAAPKQIPTLVTQEKKSVSENIKKNETTVNTDSEQVSLTTKSSEKKLYTPMEKFNAMIRTNPALKDLANELNLEVDF